MCATCSKTNLTHVHLNSCCRKLGYRGQHLLPRAPNWSLQCWRSCKSCNRWVTLSSGDGISTYISFSIHRLHWFCIVYMLCLYFFVSVMEVQPRLMSTWDNACLPTAPDDTQKADETHERIKSLTELNELPQNLLKRVSFWSLLALPVLVMGSHLCNIVISIT